MFPFPRDKYFGHAVYSLVKSLNRFTGIENNTVYWFYPYFVPSLAIASKRYRNIYNHIRRNKDNKNLKFYKQFSFPNNFLGDLINPVYQRYSSLHDLDLRPVPDIVHIHTLYGISYLAYRYAKRKKIPFVITLRRELNEALENYLPEMRKLIIKSLKSADLIISPSVHLNKKLFNAFGIQSEVVVSGTDPIFDTHSIRPGKNHNVIVFVGELNKNKSIRLLVSTFLNIQNLGYDIKLKIVGDGPLFSEISSVADLNKNIDVFGYRAKNEVLSVLKSSGIFCMPSQTETLGLAYIEAMKQGLVVIGRKGTGIDGLGKNGEDYLLFNESKELKHIIIKLITNKSLSNFIGKNGYGLAKNFTWEKNSIVHERLYNKILMQKRSK